MRSEDLSFFMDKAPSVTYGEFDSFDVLTISSDTTAIKIFILDSNRQEITNFKNNILWALEDKKKKE